MISLGLSAVDQAAFESALTRTHRMRVRARIHDHDERIIHEFSGSILSGSVQVDASGTGPLGFDAKDSPIRTLDLTVLLPRKDPSWLPDAPGDEAAAFVNNFISVLYGVWVEGLSGDRLGATATAAGTSDGTYLVAADSDATDIAIGDTVRVYHGDDTPVDAGPHTITSTESAFGFTNLHLSPPTSALVTGDYLKVVGQRNSANWVDVPVFWGPITGLEQDGNQVTIHGSGKEVLGLAPSLFFRTLKLAKGTQRVTAIRKIMQAIGEARFSLPESSDRITNTWSLGKHAEPWKSAVALAKYTAGSGRQLFYDGAGRLKMRKYPAKPVWTFRGGEGGTLVSAPKVSYDMSAARNTVEVIGHGKVRAVAYPSSGPLSPWELRRNGARRFLGEVVEDDQIGKNSTAAKIANDTLAKLLSVTTTFEFESLVIPHIEEGDRIAVIVPDVRATGPARLVTGQRYEFSIQTFTIPLTSGEAMSIGINRNVSWRTRRKGHINRWG